MKLNKRKQILFVVVVMFVMLKGTTYIYSNNHTVEKYQIKQIDILKY